MGARGKSPSGDSAEWFSEMVITLDPQGVVTSCIGPAGQWPAAPADLAGQRLKDIFPADVAQVMQLALQSLGSTGVSQRLSFQLIVEGSKRHFSARLGRLEHEIPAGGALVAIWDVTEGTLSQALRVDLEASYRLLAHSAADVISVTAEDGTLVYLSPSVERLTDYPPEGLVGQPASRLGLPAVEPGSLTVEGGAAMSQRHQIRRRDGSILWVQTEARPIEWRGRPAVLRATRSISAQVEAEERVSSVLGELSEAHRRAEAASRAKSAFLAGLSHELRTPLHGILGMADLLEQTHLSEEQRQFLAAIRESGDAILGMLSDLKDLSKIESGQLDLQVRGFDLVEAVEGLADIMGSLAGAKGLELICRVSPAVPTLVEGDPQRLRQVLLTLVANAIKYTDEGEVTIEALPGEEGKLRFMVRDTGAGISPERIERLRECFAAGDDPWQREQAAGTGLIIAQKLVDMMGGTLAVSSKLGEGTSFTFELLLPETPGLEALASAAPLRGTRILAADSRAEDRQRLREGLEQAGAEVDLAGGGVEVMRILRDDPAYDCVIIDADLADLDGLSTVELIRAHGALATTRVVLTMAADTPERVGDPEALGVSAILTKPCRDEMLVRVVRAVLSTGSFHEERTPLPQDATVLVVEDNPLNMRLARDVLQRAGYRTVNARSGREALQLLDGHRIDAVLMDISLPDMDGLEATAHIRARSGWDHIPIIAMTAHAMKGDAERFLGAGLDSYLSKPVQHGELLEALEREIGKRRPLVPGGAVERDTSAVGVARTRHTPPHPEER